MSPAHPVVALADEQMPLTQRIIGIKGAGELATGVACRLYAANLRRIFMMEVAEPMAVRREVSFCEAVYDGQKTVEEITAVRVTSVTDLDGAWQAGQIPALVDPRWETISRVHPHVVVDAIIAKKNLGTFRDQAPLTIGLGPGFVAGQDVHRVVETNRGHHLGRVIVRGGAEPDTGVPGSISGYTRERLISAPGDGIFRSIRQIGDTVSAGTIVGYVADTPVTVAITGVIRGLIRTGTRVTRHLKIGDVDPRGKSTFCPTLSDKSRAVGGGVLEAILSCFNI